MNCENVHLTWKDPDSHGYRALDRMTRCTAPATTVRLIGRRGLAPKETLYCTPCAERRDAFVGKLDAAVLEARRARGEIVGD